MDRHRHLLALAGRAPDGWLVVARETLAAGEVRRLDDLLAAFAAHAKPARHHAFAPASEGQAADRALVEAVADRATACWVARRDDNARVYLVQADAEHAAVAAVGQRALAPFDSAPTVEVFDPLQPLPPYHELALLAATLLWSAAAAEPVSVARCFDGAGERGPWFDADHELVVDPAERGRLLDFLAGGEVVLMADHRMTDVVTGVANVVPASLRSDGVWVWSEASRYYLDRHRLAPDPELVGHAATSRKSQPLSPLTRHRVRAALNPNDEEGPSWRAG